MLRALAAGGMARTLMWSYSQKKQPFIRTAWPKGGRFTGCGAVLPVTPVAPLPLVCSPVLRHQIGMVGIMVRWCPPPKTHCAAQRSVRPDNPQTIAPAPYCANRDATKARDCDTPAVFETVRGSTQDCGHRDGRVNRPFPVRTQSR